MKWYQMTPYAKYMTRIERARAYDRDFAWLELNAIVERAANDDTLTNAEYVAIYDRALAIAKAMTLPAEML